MIHTLYTFETSLVLMNCCLTFVLALRKVLYLKVVETMTPSCINFSHCTTVNLCKDAKVIQSKLKHFSNIATMCGAITLSCTLWRNCTIFIGIQWLQYVVELEVVYCKADKKSIKKKNSQHNLVWNSLKIRKKMISFFFGDVTRFMMLTVIEQPFQRCTCVKNSLNFLSFHCVCTYLWSFYQ